MSAQPTPQAILDATLNELNGCHLKHSVNVGPDIWLHEYRCRCGFRAWVHPDVPAALVRRWHDEAGLWDAARTHEDSRRATEPTELDPNYTRVIPEAQRDDSAAS